MNSVHFFKTTLYFILLSLPSPYLLSKTSPLKFNGTVCPMAQARRERAWLSFPGRVTAVGLEKRRRHFHHIQNIVCSCSSGMPHILRLLPRAKNRAQAISPLQPRSFFFKVAPFQIKWVLYMYPFSN